MRVGTPALTADTDLQLALLRRSQRGNPASPCILAVVVPTLVELFVVGKKQKSGKQLVRNYGGNTQGMRYRVKNEEWRSENGMCKDPGTAKSRTCCRARKQHSRHGVQWPTWSPLTYKASSVKI